MTFVLSSVEKKFVSHIMTHSYCEDLSENIRAVFTKKMRDGQCLFSFVPYGYKKDPNDRHKILVDEEAANVVRRIFDMYISGLGTTHIANALTKDGILTPSNYKVSKGLNFKSVHISYADKGMWAYNTVNKILKNEIYIGTLIQGKESTVDYKSKKRVRKSRKDWIIIEDNHEPIISKDIFYTASKLLKSNRRVMKNKNHSDGSSVLPHIFAGKVKCKECGSSMISSGSTEINGVKYDYLVCKGQRKSKNKIICEAKGTVKLNTLIEEIERSLRNKINIFLSINENICAIKKSCNFKNDELKKSTVLNREILQADTNLKKIMNTLSALYMDKVDGIITQEHYLELYNKFSNDAKLLKEKKCVLEKKVELLKQRQQMLNDIQKLIMSYSHFENLTHDIVNQFIDYIEIGKPDDDGNREISIYWLF